jgi:hypothetical protein
MRTYKGVNQNQGRKSRAISSESYVVDEGPVFMNEQEFSAIGADQSPACFFDRQLATAGLPGEAED